MEKKNDSINNIDTQQINNILTKIYIKEVIPNIINEINNTPSGKKGDIATACFEVLGQNPHSTCEHGKPFYSCMTCSH